MASFSTQPPTSEPTILSMCSPTSLPILPPKETEKVVDKLKRENELKRLKNIKRERNRRNRQKELQEQLADIAKQKEREKKKMNSKNFRV